MQEQQKSVVETDSKSSKIIDPGPSRGDAPSGAKGRATTQMSRTILGKPGPALAAEGENQVFSSPNSVLISPCEHPNDLWTQPNVSSEEKASRLPPIRSLFFHHYDWNRWFASLATTVDNTIKMADRSFKHGRQWCIRRIDWRPRPLWSSTFLQAIQSTKDMRCIRDIDLEEVWNKVQKLKTFFYFFSTL